MKQGLRKRASFPALLALVLTALVLPVTGQEGGSSTSSSFQEAVNQVIREVDQLGQIPAIDPGVIQEAFQGSGILDRGPLNTPEQQAQVDRRNNLRKDWEARVGTFNQKLAEAKEKAGSLQKDLETQAGELAAAHTKAEGIKGSVQATAEAKGNLQGELETAGSAIKALGNRARELADILRSAADQLRNPPPPLAGLTPAVTKIDERANGFKAGGDLLNGSGDSLLEAARLARGADQSVGESLKGANRTAGGSGGRAGGGSGPDLPGGQESSAGPGIAPVPPAVTPGGPGPGMASDPGAVLPPEVASETETTTATGSGPLPDTVPAAPPAGEDPRPKERPGLGDHP